MQIMYNGQAGGRAQTQKQPETLANTGCRTLTDQLSLGCRSLALCYLLAKSSCACRSLRMVQHYANKIFRQKLHPVIWLRTQLFIAM